MSNQQCLICGQNNHCKMAAGETDAPCWCVAETFPEEIFEMLPQEKRGEKCICITCLTALKEQL